MSEDGSAGSRTQRPAWVPEQLYPFESHWMEIGGALREWSTE
ncbi:MAG TPA: hypothetical protein VGS97_14465 [Actinocrinis sp.]|nr:hypothetical protein [Actinocrinis sp.]HEV2345299.1 hypothetical protein [Actinocrinis sp.]